MKAGEGAASSAFTEESHSQGGKIMKKLFVILAALTLSVLALAGCGGQSASKTIKVGATPVPHAEILETIKPLLEKE